MVILGMSSEEMKGGGTEVNQQERTFCVLLTGSWILSVGGLFHNKDQGQMRQIG